MIKQIYLIVTFIIILLFTFSACGNEENSTTTTSSITRKVTQEQVSETRVKKTLTTKNSTSRKRSVTTKSKSTTTSVSSAVNTTAALQYKTINEIVSYYNTCINKVKTKSTTVTRNYEEILTLENNLSNGEITSTLISSYFNKGRDNSALVCSTYNEKTANFPVAGKDYSSRLDSARVKSASCTYKNGIYNIIIYLKDDTAGQNYSSTCLSVASAEWVSNTCNGIIEKDKMTLSCKNCVIKCTVNASTGNVVYLNTYMPTVVNLTEFEKEQSFSFSIKQDWSISY